MLYPDRHVVACMVGTIVFWMLLTIALQPADEYRTLERLYEPEPVRYETSNVNGSDSDSHDIDWSRFAYVQYATSSTYLCNSMMIVERLHSLGSKADRLIMYSKELSSDDGGIQETLLTKARDVYGANLKPVDFQPKYSSKRESFARGFDKVFQMLTRHAATWDNSFTKVLALNQTEYDRVLYLDSDATVLQNMDKLFLMPPAVAAMPRSYWNEKPKLGSQLLLLQPSRYECERIKTAIDTAKEDEYDMKIINNLYGDTAMVLPYKEYGLTSTEFAPLGGTQRNHSTYLGDATKPWFKSALEIIESVRPPCAMNPGEHSFMACREYEIWKGLHEDFKTGRKNVCGLDLI